LESNEAILPNTFGVVVRDYGKVDFVARRHKPHAEYNVELIRTRVFQKNELVFGTLCNYVQYFTEVGGFDALLNLFSMGQEESEVLRIQKNDSVKSNNDPAVVKLPFKIISALTQAFTHLDNVFTVDFSKLFSNTVKEQIMNRLDTMTERDLKDVDKDEI